MAEPVVTYRSEGSVAVITLNRPEKLNAINPAMCEALRGAFERLQAGEDRVGILTGAGTRAFTAGADVNDVPQLWRCVPGVGVALDKPLIAAVRGHAVGQGCELAGVCDLTIASETARIGEIQIRHGYPPPILITPYLVGQKQAKELLLLGEAADAQDALRLGLVNRVVPDGELEAAAEAMAKKLAALPPNTVRLNKLLVNRVYELAGLRGAMAWADDAALRALWKSEDAVAAERHRVRNEQGWAAFKQERDQGYRQ